MRKLTPEERAAKLAAQAAGLEAAKKPKTKKKEEAPAVEEKAEVAEETAAATDSQIGRAHV